MIKRLAFLFLMLASFFAGAQDAVHEPEMADSFRADGKIYVVTSVMAIIFAALLLYLIVIDRKVKKLEDDMKNKNL
ncbi:MAG: CcmD family protein [Bacteroidia bacterium]